MNQPVNELEAFNSFVQQELGGLNGMTLQAALDEFLAYRQSVEAIRDKLGQAQAESDRGESTPLDGDSTNARTLYDAFAEDGSIGCYDGPADLSTNPKHIEGFGRSERKPSSD